MPHAARIRDGLDVRGRDLDPAVVARLRRVNVLLGAIVVLGMADLALTVLHLKTTGMFEANPIAAFVIRWTGSAWALAFFKVVSLALCTGLLYSCRRSRAAEVAAWVGAGVMIAITIAWEQYARAMDEVRRTGVMEAYVSEDLLRVD